MNQGNEQRDKIREIAKGLPGNEQNDRSSRIITKLLRLAEQQDNNEVIKVIG